jgi:uncharacterized OB-fold protein
VSASPAPAHPGLYDPHGEPALRGDRCTRCATPFFPASRWGCECCGAPADALEPASLDAVGLLLTFATVRLGDAPYTIGEILLDAGPVIRASMLPADGEGLDFGARVRGRLVGAGQDHSGTELVTLCFVQAA